MGMEIGKPRALAKKKRKTPTLVLAAGESAQKLSVPSYIQLASELDQLGLLSLSKASDGSSGLE